MPVHIERRNGKDCVVEPGGSVVPSGCYDDHDEALARMRAINANTEKSLRGFTVQKDDSGLWQWIGVVSNNWIDTHLEILTSKAHRRFVELIDSGKYGEMILDSYLAEVSLFKEIGERGTPDLLYWHIPVPIGYTDMVAFVEPTTKDGSGFLIATGRQKEGELYNTIFEGISESEPGEYGMSHGVPEIFFIKSTKHPQHVDGYLSTEFTVLPAGEAANFGTGIGVMKEGTMNIPKYKLAHMRQKFGDEVVAQFGVLLEELEIFAIDSKIPRKEKTMNVDTVDALIEADALETEEVETEEVETEEVEEAEAEVESEAVAESSDETGDEEEQDETGMALKPTGFRVPTDLPGFAQEIATAMKEVMSTFQDQQNVRFDAIQGQLDEQRTEITKMKERRVVEKEADTPLSSMASWMSADIGSVIGKDETRIHGNTDREFFNRTKQDEVESPAVPGVAPMISKIIQGQRGKQRQYATSALGLNQGQEA